VKTRTVSWIFPLVAMAGCDGSRTAPLLLVPTQGAATGSVWASGPGPSPLRPAFLWTAVLGASGYEVEVDDSCADASSCDFPSPEVQALPTEASFVPSQNLPVSLTPPVGRRYYWRVRACYPDGCSLWSRTGYLDVGRQRQDFNGDGYADLAVVAGGTTRNAVFVYFGGPQGITTVGWTDRGGDTVGYGFSRAFWAGDMNGDGFSELAAVVSSTAGDAVRFYPGGAAPGLTPLYETTAVSSAPATVVWPQAAGDLNGDGYADVAWMSLGQDAQGDPTAAYQAAYGETTMPVLSAAEPVASTADVVSCDYDSDGFADLIGTTAAGTLGVFHGGVDGPFSGATPFSIVGGSPLVCAANVNGRGGASILSSNAGAPVLQSSGVPPGTSACDGPIPAVSGYPLSIDSVGGGSTRAADVGDTDGDGFEDLIVGDPSDNRAALIFGGCPVSRVLVLPGQSDQGGTAQGGYSVAGAGDLNGDGFPDFAVGNPYAGIDSFCSGEVYVYQGGPAASAVPAVVLTDPDGGGVAGSCTGDGFGASLD
jgi:FG-GAP repeat